MLTQTVELVGGPRDGEVWTYQYTGNPAFDVVCDEANGSQWHYRMCSDGKFRLSAHADEFEKQEKQKAKRKK